MARAPFIIHPHGDLDKSIHVQGPGDLNFDVDFDDVNHEEVRQDLTKMVGFLNHMWGLNS
jgi:hypothetical protein